MTEGDWISRASDEHKCKKPQRVAPGTPKPQVGDRWQCHRCRMIYNVTGLDYGDQRDPINPPAIKWGIGYIMEEDLR